MNCVPRHLRPPPRASSAGTSLDVASGKASLTQLPVPKPATVALLGKLGGLEGKDVK